MRDRDVVCGYEIGSALLELPAKPPPLTFPSSTIASDVPSTHSSASISLSESDAML